MWYIIRHGETYHNVSNIKPGKTPSLLTLRGIDQIKSIGSRLNDIDEDFSKYKFIVSPYARTRHTIQIILEVLKLQNVPIIENLLEEINIGDFENKSHEEITKNFPEFLNNDIDFAKKEDRERFYSRKYPNGESHYEVYDRILKFYEKYKNEENLVIVTHSCCVAFLQDVILGIKKEKLIPKSINQNYFYSWNGKEIKQL